MATILGQEIHVIVTVTNPSDVPVYFDVGFDGSPPSAVFVPDFIDFARPFGKGTSSETWLKMLPFGQHNFWVMTIQPASDPVETEIVLEVVQTFETNRALVFKGAMSEANPRTIGFETFPNDIEPIIDVPVIGEIIPHEVKPTSDITTNDPRVVTMVETVQALAPDLVGGVTGTAGLPSSLIGSLIGFFRDPVGALVGRFETLFQRSAEESIKTALSAVDDVVSQSPEWKTEIDEKITAYTGDLVARTLKELSPEAIGDSPLSPERASQMLTVAGVAGLGIHTAAFIGGIVAEAATLGQLDGFARISAEVLDKLGLGELSRAMVMTPLEPLLLTPARQFWNAEFPSEIPDAGELINMVVKEVITLDTFKTLMKYQGFNENHSQNIWDAHFIAPSLGQLLTSFRRKTITESELTDLQILVDLDPRYDAIWLDQRYNDPTPRQGRFMFETGEIGVARLRDIVVRSGLVPEFVDPFTGYLAKFQERIWQRRYLVALSAGYRAGVYDESRVRSEVEAAGYSSGVADWMIAAEDVHKEIQSAKVPPEKFSLISVSYATDAFINADVDESWLREYFDRKGYVSEDIDIAIGVLERKRAKKVAG